jgi:hypothetical protein
MRVTVTLDPDVNADLRKLMRDESIAFKDAVNRMLLRGFRAWDKRDRGARKSARTTKKASK